jgi:hypothetical protein
MVKALCGAPGLDKLAFMGRITIVVLALAVGCGGPRAKDFEVQSDFVAGSDAPPAWTFDNGALTRPISGEPAHIKGISLTSATLRSVDGSDLSYLQSVQIVAADAPTPFVVAALQSPPAAGASLVRLQLSSDSDLTSHLKSGGRLDAVFTYATAPAAPHQLELTLRLHGIGIGIASAPDDGSDTFVPIVPADPGPDPGTTDPGPPPPTDDDPDPGDPAPGDCCDLHAPKAPRPAGSKNATGPKR